jgi:hypothetical protein
MLRTKLISNTRSLGVGIASIRFISGTANAQCTNGSSYGSAVAPNTSGAPVTITTCQYQTEYATITSVLAGETYIADNSNGGCVTVHQGTPAGPIIDFGNVPLTWTATVAGTYYLHWTDNCACATSTGCDVTTIECVTCTGPPPPGPCTGDIVVNSTYYSNSGLTTCGFGDDYSSLDACGSSYMNGDDIVIEWTPTTTECVEVALSNTGTWVGVFITDGCPDDPGAACLANSTASGGNPTISGFNVTAGTTYYITVSTWPSPQCTAFDIDIAPCPPPPANDECNNAETAPVNPDNLCGSTVSGTIQAATSSWQANSCGGASDDDDVWYEFTATNTTHTIDLLNVTGSTTDLYHSVFSGSCGALGAAILCSDPNSSVLTGLTIGNTYYVRVYTWSSTSGQTTDFDICIGTPPPPPGNDECNTAFPAAVSSTSCTPTTGTIASATPSWQANGCGGTANDDVWYSFVATTPAVQINLTNIFGGTTDLYHSVYAGTCGALGAALVCSDPNNSTLTGLTPGNTYYVRIFSWTSTVGQTSVFDLCIMEAGVCGTPNNQDYCVAPAIITEDGGTFSANTSGTYTSDTPGNLNALFCGSIENNSWYEFVADATTETFNFSSVTNCTSGIQAEVYEVTEDVNGCCTGFTSMSNCWNPATATSGTVTATGLTIGNTYVLMVDGFGGDICDFTVANWSAIGILPVELEDFNGMTIPRENVLNWITVSEKDNDYFDVMRSFDGVNFEKIGSVDGAGNTVAEQTYKFIDEDIRTGITYYQLEQVDFNGSRTKSKVIALNRSQDENGILSVWPNPTNDQLYIELNVDNIHENETIVLLDSRGNNVHRERLTDAGYSQVQIDMNNLSSGVYILVYTDIDGNQYTEKIVKK